MDKNVHYEHPVVLYDVNILYARWGICLNVHHFPYPELVTGVDRGYADMISPPLM